jgi:Flp pilus assembly protein TadD
MKTKSARCLFLGLLIFAVGTPLAAAEVVQTTGNGSWCSPVQSGSGNTVVCNSVDARAMDRLNELLDRKDLDLRQKTVEANDWAHRYNELNAQLEETKKRLAAKGDDPTLVETAQDLLHEGRLSQARTIFDRLLASDEANVDRAAEDYFGRATVSALQFRLDEALSDYARAYQYRPGNQGHAEGYAYALTQQKDYAKAELVIRALLKQWRTKVIQEPSHRPNLAQTLNNLAIIYRHTGRTFEAEEAYGEATAIQRELASENPTAYRPDLAKTLNNLGVLYWSMKRHSEAERTWKEAVAIGRDLAAQNPALYRPDLAQALNSLGALHWATKRISEAEATLREALTIRRELAGQHPAAYRPDLAQTLNNLAIVYRGTDRPAEAEFMYREAVAIQRELAEQNPSAYQLDLAHTLNNLGSLYRETHRFDEAEVALKGSEDILRGLTARDPVAYHSDLAVTLNNLASLYRDTHRNNDADVEETEALAAAAYGTNSSRPINEESSAIINDER